MGPKAVFKDGVACGSAILRFVKPEHFNSSTPCTEWNMRQLVSHMLYELAWVPDVLAGKTVDAVGDVYDGDLIGNDLTASWDSLADKANAAVKAANLNGIVHLSYGDVPLSQYLLEVGSDLMIHSWDVAQSLLCNLWFAKEIAELVYMVANQRADEYAASGMFGERIEVADDADIQDRLLGFYGRRAPAID